VLNWIGLNERGCEGLRPQIALISAEVHPPCVQQYKWLRAHKPFYPWVNPYCGGSMNQRPPKKNSPGIAKAG
jgi:hypothetical protein